MHLNRNLFAVLIVLFLPSLGVADGSIVINNGAPRAELMFHSVSRESRQLDATWTEVQIMDALRRALRAEFGERADELPFSLNPQREEVSFYNPVSEVYETISFASLLDE